MGKEEKDGKAEETGRRAGGILREAGKIFGYDGINGIRGILKKMEKLPGFKERLNEIDEEIERRLKESPLNMAEGGFGRVESIPPGIRGTPVQEKRPGAKRPAPIDVSTDVFDEDDYLLVAADLPGVEEKTIEASLDGDVLTLSFKKEGSVLKKKLKLPCAPEGEPVKAYKNGILEVKIKK